VRHPHDAARRQEQSHQDPRDVSGIEAINAEAEAKHDTMPQCANPVCERDAEYRETIDTSYMSHTDADTSEIDVCGKHVDPTGDVRSI